MEPRDAGAAFGSFRTWLTRGPAADIEAGDRASIAILGLRFPVRATAALLAVMLLVLLDYHGRVDALLGLPAAAGDAEALRNRAIGRLVLQGLVPLLLVMVLLRDRPARYGLRLGDWRAGLAIGGAGILAMLPVVALLAGQEDFRVYYGRFAAAPVDVFLTSAIEVIPAEFFFRGFLLFALLRAIGPLGLIVATIPFAFAHLGKPELETLSTLFGGAAYGWLDWRTGSVLWSGLAHATILSAAVLLAA